MDNIEKRAKKHFPDILDDDCSIPTPAEYIIEQQRQIYILGATEQKAIDDALIKKLFEKAWSLADSMYQVGKDHLTPLTHQEFIKEMEDIARALDK